MLRRPAFTVFVGALLWSSPTLAQERGPATDSLTPGARAARVVIDPFPVRITRGDSIVVRFTMMDSIGAELKGVRWALETDSGVTRHHLVDSTAAYRSYAFSGDTPGTQTFWVAVRVPGAPGRPVTRVLDSVAVTVADWPVGKIEIGDLAFEAYAGTTFRLKAKVLTSRNTELENPRVTWATDDPCHARVMPDGVVSFGSPTKMVVTARAEGHEGKKEIRIVSNPVQTLEISPHSAQTRVGDVVKFKVYASDRRGEKVDKIALSYAVRAIDSAGAFIDDDGYFVAERPGTYVVEVSAGSPSAEAMVEVAPRPAPSSLEVAGRGPIKGAATGGLWVFTGKDGRDYAYTGASSGRLYVWNVGEAGDVTLSDSIVFDATVIGDVKVNGDASWAVVARSGAAGSRNGISVLDLASPAHPKVTAELGDNLVGGITRLWVSGNWVYAVNAGAGALDVVDLSSPGHPRYAGRWENRPGEVVKLDEVWGDQKNLYLAHGPDGLVILDVADQGSPTNPKVVSRLKWKRAAAHSVVRAGRYAYVGEAIEGCEQCVSGSQGAVRVIDVSKIKEPKEVGRYQVPEAGSERVWVENATLYVGFRQGGVRLVDVGGELRGDLYRQGRQAGWFMTAATDETTHRPYAAMALAAMPFKGYVFVTDANSGLWVLRHQRGSRLTP